MMVWSLARGSIPFGMFRALCPQNGGIFSSVHSWLPALVFFRVFRVSIRVGDATRQTAYDGQSGMKFCFQALHIGRLGTRSSKNSRRNFFEKKNYHEKITRRGALISHKYQD